MEIGAVVIAGFWIFAQTALAGRRRTGIILPLGFVILCVFRQDRPPIDIDHWRQG
ncbi:hypothetical protein D3C72_2536400 [compost metagenome]